MPLESYAVRITLPCELVAPWLDDIQAYVEGIVAYQHNDNPDNIHTHIFILQSKVSKERLKQLSSTYFTGKGNQFWSWKKAADTWLIYLTYMSKGTLDPQYLYGGISPELCAEQKVKWVKQSSKITPGHKAYLVFQEDIDRLMKVPGISGISYSDILNWSKHHCRKKHGYYSAACNVQIINYAYTYCSDKGIPIPKEKSKF